MERRKEGMIIDETPPSPLPLPRLPPEGIDYATASILTFDPLEVARQLTLSAYHYVITKINPRDLLLEENYEPRGIDSIISAFDFDTVVQQVQGKTGFEVKDRRREKRLKTYPKCFIASEAVTWLQKNLSITREQAIIWGKHLQDNGIIDHVSSKGEFKEFSDSDNFFKFINASQRPDLVQHRIQELFLFDVENVGPLRSFLNRSLAQIQQLVLREIHVVRTRLGTPEMAIQCWISVAIELVKLNNWHSLQGILAGLQASLTKDNKPSWGKVNTECREWFISTRRIFLSKDEVARKVLSLPSPCIPSVSVYLELVHNLQKENGPPNIDGMVNVKRMMALGNAVLQFSRIQRVVPAYQEVPVLIDFLGKPPKM